MSIEALLETAARAFGYHSGLSGEIPQVHLCSTEYATKYPRIGLSIEILVSLCYIQQPEIRSAVHSNVKSRFKIFSDPVHGFISVPKGPVLDLIQTPEVQRLRRIRQLGIGYLVFPGAEHSRFGHALGAMALMHNVLTSLSEKGTAISPEEHTAALAAALLHDIGHGPFSHTLEHELIDSFEHEFMSRVLIGRLNEQMDGALSLALRMFDDDYERPFFYQLISSQLDMDRLDYLRRDSYYTGVAEGRVGVDRIIKTLRVHPDNGTSDDQIVVEAKGVHAVENFLIARRLMYWQVYLHKTILAGDHLLRGIIRRSRSHFVVGDFGPVEGTAPAFQFFLENTVTGAELENEDVVRNYCALDDSDILYSLKRWQHSSDVLLSDLCRRMLNRDFFRVTFLDTGVGEEAQAQWRENVHSFLLDSGLSRDDSLETDTPYYLNFAESGHAAYERAENSIAVVQRDGNVVELSEATQMSAISGIASPERRPYMCYPKELS
ncbi:MAG: HD domain-containing protein [Rhodothermia bacterium]|nr:MAG: HD domain-containing protein [Rhodothermia bacterium]